MSDLIELPKIGETIEILVGLGENGWYEVESAETEWVNGSVEAKIDGYYYVRTPKRIFGIPVHLVNRYCGWRRAGE